MASVSSPGGSPAAQFIVDVIPSDDLLGNVVTAVVGAGALLVIAEVVGSLKIVIVGAVIALFLIGGINITVD